MHGQAGYSPARKVFSQRLQFLFVCLGITFRGAQVFLALQLRIYSQWCSGTLGIEPVPAICKANTLPTALSLWLPKVLICHNKAFARSHVCSQDLAQQDKECFELSMHLRGRHPSEYEETINKRTQILVQFLLIGRSYQALACTAAVEGLIL